jgi:hypothetical protein
MGLFNTLMSKIFNHSSATAPAAGGPTSSTSRRLLAQHAQVPSAAQPRVRERRARDRLPPFN